MKLLHYAFRGLVASSNWWSGWYRGKEASVGVVVLYWLLIGFTWLEVV